MMTFTLVYIVVYGYTYKFSSYAIKIFEFFTGAGERGEFRDRIVLTIMVFLITLVIVRLFLFLY